MKIKSVIFRLAKQVGFSNNLIMLNLSVKRYFGIKQKDFVSLYGFYQQFIQKGNVVFDIGANVGNRSEVFLALGAKVVAIEPNEKLCNILRTRFKNKDITILNNGMGEMSESKEFSVATNTLVSSFSDKFMDMKQKRGEHDDWQRKVVIEVKTLDQIVSRFGSPDFCKIDVEGYEQEVLKGLTSKVKSLSFEFTSPDFNEETIWCINKLMALGFKEFNISYKETLQLEFAVWIDGTSMLQYLMENEHMREKWYGDIYARS